MTSRTNKEANDTRPDAKTALVVGQQFNDSRPHSSIQQMVGLFRRVYCLLLLRVLGSAAVEGLAVIDDSIRAFYSGHGGVVVVSMTLLISFIMSAYMSFSAGCGPENPSNRRKLITLLLLEAMVHAGVAVYLFDSNPDSLVDLFLLDASAAVFFASHVVFFFNQRVTYHMIYGIVWASLCISASAISCYVMSQSNSIGWNVLESGRAFALIIISSFMWVCCVWYSIETHVVIRNRHRFKFNDCIFLLLCFTYFDVWNVLAKCKLMCIKSDPIVSTTV